MEDIKKQIAEYLEETKGEEANEDALTETQKNIADYVFQHLMDTPETDYDIAVALEAVAQRFYWCHDEDMRDRAFYGE